METFYQKFPQYKIQANHRIFLDAAEQDGGSEVLTAEWMELQLDSLHGQLAVRQNPVDALNHLMQENPGFDCLANRQIILQRVRDTNEAVNEAVTALKGHLAFNQDAHSEHATQLEQQAIERRAQLEQQERVALIDKLRHVPIESLRTAAQEVRERKAFRDMSVEQLREYTRKQREQTSPAAAPQLPAEVTAQKIKAMSPDEIRRLNRVYGQDAVNTRLGYVKPVIGGLVRDIRLEFDGKSQ
jgi:hypothetical protein